MTAPLDAAALRAALDGTVFASSLHLHDEVASTIDRCRALADEGAPEGTVVLAARQAAGRGQPGHSWSSPPGGVYLSALLRPRVLAPDAGVLAAVAGLAACEALRALGMPCRIKLPNDLVAPERGTWRKLGGMLVDTAIQGDRVRHAIVSLGVNVAWPAGGVPPEVAEIATCCASLGAQAPSREAVAAGFLRRLGAEALDDQRNAERIVWRRDAHVRKVLPGQPCGESED